VGGFLLALELFLFFLSLEATMTELGRRVDELDVQRTLFQRRAVRHRRQRFSECKDSFFGTDSRPFNHEKIFVNDTEAREATERGDALVLSDISRSGARVGVSSRGDSVDLLVDFSTMIITILTGSRHRPLHSTWMP